MPDGVTTEARWPLSCRPIVVRAGPEDIVIDRQAGLAYVSATDRRAVLGQRPLPEDGRLGHLYRIDLKVDEPFPEDVTPPNLRHGAFQPHGLSLLKTSDGARLFVINHGPDAGPERSGNKASEVSHRIELIDIAPDGRLVHVETVTSGFLTSPNDLAAIGPRQFYVTNDHGTMRGPVLNFLGDLFGLNAGNVVYFDGSSFVEAATDILYANGVTADAAARRLYVTSSGDGSFRIFRWEESDPSRIAEAGPRVMLGSAADNVDFDDEGALLVAAHPRRLRLLLYFAQWFGVSDAPSQIIRLQFIDSSWRAVEIFRAAGDESEPQQISAASVAVSIRRANGGLRLLLGSIMSDRVLLCDSAAR